MDSTDRENVRDYLSAYRKGILRIGRCRLLMEELEQIGQRQVTTLAACEEEMLCENLLATQKKELEDVIWECKGLCRSVQDTVESLDGIEKEVLRLRYIEGKIWNEIANQAGYSVGNIHRIHKKALERIAVGRQ